nr:CrcB family protein [Nocardia carnea]
MLEALTRLCPDIGRRQRVRLGVGTGFCGAFTTFSTASFETVRLIQNEHYRIAAINAWGTLSTTIAAAGAGLALAGM